MDLSAVKLLSFDCYGTLIDWKKGVLDILEPFFNEFQLDFSREELFEAFLNGDRSLEAGEYIPYREILAEIVLFMADELRVSIDPASRYLLSERFGEWHPFPDTVKSLRELKKNYQLAILSNVDDAMFGITNALLEVDFDYIITAEQLGSYKPSANNFLKAAERFELQVPEMMHVAQSIYHDIVPSNKLGWNNTWVNRYGEPRRTHPLEIPDLEVPDLASLLTLLNGS